MVCQYILYIEKVQKIKTTQLINNIAKKISISWNKIEVGRLVEFASKSEMFSLGDDNLLW